MTISPVMLPADPRHVRALTLEHSSGSGYDADVRTGAPEGGAPRAIDSRTNHGRARDGSSVDARDKGARVVHGCSALPPAVSQNSQGDGGQGIRSVERTAGDSGGGERCVVPRRQKPERPAIRNHRSGVEEEEERLMASIARLDTLLREESGRAVAKASSRVSDSPRSGPGVRTDPLKSGREMERKPAVREPVGGIAKSRVRKGPGKETKTCGSSGVAPTMVPKVGSSHGVSAPAVSGVADEHAVSAAPSSRSMFPPLFSRVPPCPSERRERGRYAPPGADKVRASSPVAERVTPRMPASHIPGTSHHDTGREQRWTGRRDDRRGSGEAMPLQYHRPHHDNGRGGGDIARNIGGIRRQEEWVQRTAPSPRQRNRDARYGDSSGGWHGYSGGGHDYYSERAAATDPRDAWDVREERRGWAGEPHSDDQQTHDGRCRGGAPREWDRCVSCALYLSIPV